ncbi:hypothetical protein ACOME3_005495 [Neoechinorhynchus agilis]
MTNYFSVSTTSPTSSVSHAAYIEIPVYSEQQQRPYPALVVGSCTDINIYLIENGNRLILGGNFALQGSICVMNVFTYHKNPYVFLVLRNLEAYFLALKIKDSPPLSVVIRPISRSTITNALGHSDDIHCPSRVSPDGNLIVMRLFNNCLTCISVKYSIESRCSAVQDDGLLIIEQYTIFDGNRLKDFQFISPQNGRPRMICAHDEGISFSKLKETNQEIILDTEGLTHTVLATLVDLIEISVKQRMANYIVEHKFPYSIFSHILVPAEQLTKTTIKYVVVGPNCVVLMNEGQYSIYRFPEKAAVLCACLLENEEQTSTLIVDEFGRLLKVCLEHASRHAKDKLTPV